MGPDSPRWLIVSLYSKFLKSLRDMRYQKGSCFLWYLLDSYFTNLMFRLLTIVNYCCFLDF